MKTNRAGRILSAILGALSMTTCGAGAADWTSAPAMDVPRQQFGAATDEWGNIWVLGGFNRTGGCCCYSGPPVFDSVEKLAYDGTSYAETWELTSIVMPTPRWIHSAVISRGFIYVLGGFDVVPNTPGMLPLAPVHRYDILSDSWSTDAVPPLNEPRANGAAITDRLGRIWFIGGEPQSGPLSFSATVEIFDPARPELGWQIGPSLNLARASFGCVLDPMGRIYAIGGYGVVNGIQSHIQSVERIDPCESDSWTVLPEQLPAPTTNNDESVLGADGRIYVVGGWTGTWTDRVLRMDPQNETWETWNSLATPRSFHRVLLGHDGNIYAIGGNVSGCIATATVEKLSTEWSADDTDGDGLLDSTEVDIAECSACPDPLDSDSDGDTLPDGDEVALGTDPCLADSDGDGVPDDQDPFPTEPGVSSGFIEDALRGLCDTILGLDLAVIDGPNDNAAEGRRNAMCNKATAAANAVAAGDVADAIDQLTSLLAKLDGAPQPEDWMHDSAEKDALRGGIELLITLLEFLL